MIQTKYWARDSLPGLLNNDGCQVGPQLPGTRRIGYFAHRHTKQDSTTVCDIPSHTGLRGIPQLSFVTLLSLSTLAGWRLTNRVAVSFKEQLCVAGAALDPPLQQVRKVAIPSQRHR